MIKIVACVIAYVFLHFSAMGEIRFVSATNWKEILAEAQKEQKYIFIDCYASWCAPCKLMDKTVYQDKRIGTVYNGSFLCIRVQMDKSASDNAATKAMYSLAASLQQDYNVNAYPTYLFFRPDGTPVHKSTGSMNVDSFLRLATDAHEPKRQYYTLLKNFTPGKTDTAEERALANTFFRYDTLFAGKLAADYLQRTPENRLSTPVNIGMINRFQLDSNVRSVLNAYLDNHENHPDLKILLVLHKWPKAQEIAAKYIHMLSEDSLYTEKNIQLMSIFTASTSDRGFQIFLNHPGRVDSAIKSKGYSQSRVVSIIKATKGLSTIEQAKQKNTVPDFQILEDTLTREFGKELAHRTVIETKLAWYKYRVFTLKDTLSWPHLIDEQIKQILETRADTLDNNAIAINNICYLWIFSHSNSQAQLDKAVSWMKQIVSRYANTTGFLDTYASLIYKAGNINDALSIERKALNIALQKNNQEDAYNFRQTIKRMSGGEKIWLTTK